MQENIGENKYLSPDNTSCLKGVFAVFVLIHHLYQYSGLFHNSLLGMILQALGYLSVGMFFFYTGYGMMCSKNKEGYGKTIGKKRILPLYIFYVFLILLYSLWQMVLQYPLTPSRFFQSFFFGNTIVPLGWYLQVTFVVYLILWAVFSSVKSDKQCLLITGIALLLYCIVCCLIGLSSTWYESIFCVLLGMTWAVYKDSIDRNIARKKWMAFIITGFIFVVFLAGAKVSPVLQTEVKIISAVAFAVFVTVATIVLPRVLYNNPVTKILGKYSLEIYVCQGFFLLLRKEGRVYIDNPYVFIGIVIIGTAILAVLMKPMFTKIIKVVKNKETKVG